MSAMGLRATSPVFVGRQAEMARLAHALDVAAEGGSAVVLVAGEAGVGKTRLVHELAGLADERRFRVCVGRCVDLGAEIWPLAPLREIVGALVDDMDSDALDLVLGGARNVLAPLVPELGVESAGEPMSSDRLCELVVGMFKRLAQRGPLMVVVEDLHWADGTTRTLFSAVARVGRIRPLLLVGTFRSDELHRRHPLRPMLAEIERGGWTERIDVWPFDRAATAELIDAIGGGTVVDRSYVDDVQSRSGGNPFFVEELVAARTSGSTRPPNTLRDAVVSRAAELDDRALEVLGVAAAAGAASPDVLADVCGLEPEMLRTTLDELLATALLVPDGDDVRFRHELGREVFYDDLVPGERARVHARLAASLEVRRPERLGEIARHWSAAHDTSRALAASVVAGRQALGAGAAAEAEGHLGRALELWYSVGDPAALAGCDHPDLLVQTAVAARHARDLDRAIELAQQAVAELVDVDPVREGEVWLQLHNLYGDSYRWDDCFQAVARALALIPAEPPSKARAEALTNAALERTLIGRYTEAMAIAREAVAVAELVDDPEILVYAHHSVIWAMSRLGDFDDALTHALANLARCGPDVSTERTLTAYHRVAVALFDLGRYAEVPAIAEPAVELARRSGLGGRRGAVLVSHWVWSLAVLGRWTEAEAVATEFDDLLDHPSGRADRAVTWGTVLIRQGRFEEARPLIEQARAELRRHVWLDDLAGIVAAIVLFDSAEGRGADAEALVDEMLERGPGHHYGDVHLVDVGITALADGALGESIGRHDGAAERARATATRWIEWLDSTREGWRPGLEKRLLRERALAQLGRLKGESDPQQWAHLAAGWKELGLRYDEAKARFHQAEAMLAGTAGRAASARQSAFAELAAAHAIAEELHAAPLLRDIASLAQRARLSLDTNDTTDRPDDDTGGNRFGLTARELDVLELLAQGRSNGGIGRELFISTKTASVHVSNILRKLGVANRVEAAAFAAGRVAQR